MSNKTRLAYRCVECGGTDRFTVSDPVIATFWIVPLSLSPDDGESYHGEPFETIALYDVDVPNAYRCHDCGETADIITDLAEIVEVTDEDEEEGE